MNSTDTDIKVGDYVRQKVKPLDSEYNVESDKVLKVIYVNIMGNNVRFENNNKCYDLRRFIKAYPLKNRLALIKELIK
jgi:hypothetical protein